VGAGSDPSVGRLLAFERPPRVVDIVVGIGGTQHTVSASVEDRSHMDYPPLLGRDILKHYRVDVTRQAQERGGDRVEMAAEE